jgi:hypothetical protein
MPEGSIGRDPQQEARTLRFMQNIQLRLNALERNGELVLDALGGYTVVNTAAHYYANRVYGPKSVYGIWGG